MTRRKQLVAASAALLLISLSGCSAVDDLIEQKSGTEKGNPMKPLEAHAHMEQLLNEAGSVLGGQWRIAADGNFPEQCDIGQSTDGLYFEAAWVQEGRSDYDEATNNILRYWQARGFTIETASFAPDHRLVGGDRPDGTTVDYSIDGGIMTISAVTPCVPGDWLEVRREQYKKSFGHYPDARVQPSDEPSSTPPSG